MDSDNWIKVRVTTWTIFVVVTGAWAYLEIIEFWLKATGQM